MVHTRSGAGTEPLTLSADLAAVAREGVTCPVCYEQRALCCMALAKCGHGVCIACAPGMLYANLSMGTVPCCPVCREGSSDGANGMLFLYLYEPGFRDAAVKLLRRLATS